MPFGDLQGALFFWHQHSLLRSIIQSSNLSLNTVVTRGATSVSVPFCHQQCERIGDLQFVPNGRVTLGATTGRCIRGARTPVTKRLLDLPNSNALSGMVRVEIFPRRRFRIPNPWTWNWNWEFGYVPNSKFQCTRWHGES